MIPDNITESHIVKAIQRINRHGVPQHREAKDYFLIYARRSYPAKYVVGIANLFANGKELDPESFSGGKETNKFLQSLGFDISSSKFKIPFKIARVVLEFPITPSKLKNAKNKWTLLAKTIWSQYKKEKGIFYKRLEQIALFCLKKNTNALILPAYTLLHESRNELKKYFSTLQDINWVLTGALTGARDKDTAIVLEKGKPIVSFNSENPIKVDFFNYAAIVAISSTIGSAKNENKIIVKSNAPVSAIFDIGHHQYNGHYMRKLKSVHNAYAEVNKSVITILSWWKCKNTFSKGLWAVPEDLKNSMNRFSLSTSCGEDWVDIFSLSDFV